MIFVAAEATPAPGSEEAAVPDWDTMLSPTMPVLELVLRGTITFLVLMALMRVVGQREAGGLGLTDLLVVVLVADAASAGFRGDASSVADGLVLVVTVLAWSVLLDAVGYRWPRLARVIKGRPRPLIRDGEVDRRAMRRELMTMDELLEQLRQHGIDDPRDVERAWLEPNGVVTVVSRDAGQDGGGEPATT